jgi:hypothetical protein
MTVFKPTALKTSSIAAMTVLKPTALKTSSLACDDSFEANRP